MAARVLRQEGSVVQSVPAYLRYVATSASALGDGNWRNPTCVY